MNNFGLILDRVSEFFASIINKQMNTCYTIKDVERILASDGIELRITDEHGYWEAATDFIDGEFKIRCYSHSTAYDWIYIND